MKPLPSASSSSTPSRVPSDRIPGVGAVPNEEDVASELVDLGRRVADGELRDAVTEGYVDEANAGDETDEALDDIARAEAEEASADPGEEIGPENDAIYREVSPED